MVFQLGNSSTAFLLLRAQGSGFSASAVSLLYLTYNLIGAALSLPFGGLSDRIGRRALLLAGYLLYAISYGAAAFAPTRAGAITAFVVLAAHSALIEGQSRSLIADLVPRERRATAFGTYHAAVGAALLPASIVAGLLWERVGPQAPAARLWLVKVCMRLAISSLEPNSSSERPRQTRSP